MGFARLRLAARSGPFGSSACGDTSGRCAELQPRRLPTTPNAGVFDACALLKRLSWRLEVRGWSPTIFHVGLALRRWTDPEPHRDEAVLRVERARLPVLLVRVELEASR